MRFRVEARCRKRPPKPPPTEPPYIVRLLDKAVQWQRLLDAGQVRTRAELAARAGVTAARISQVLALLKLDPRIRATIRSLPPGTPARAVTERALRRITRCSAKAQPRVFRERFRRLLHFGS